MISPSCALVNTGSGFYQYLIYTSSIILFSIYHSPLSQCHSCPIFYSLYPFSVIYQLYRFYQYSIFSVNFFYVVHVHLSILLRNNPPYRFYIFSLFSLLSLSFSFINLASHIAEHIDSINILFFSTNSSNQFFFISVR